MHIDKLRCRQFLPDRRAVRRAILGAFLLLWVPVVGLAQTLTVEMSRGPLQDERLRLAIMHSTDWMRAAEITGLDVRSVVFRHADDTVFQRDTPQDIERAKFLLLEMGGVSPRTPVIVVFDPRRTEKLAQILADNLQQLGLRLRLVPLTEEARAEMLKTMRSRIDVSDQEPGYIMLTWHFADIVQPVPRTPEPERDVPNVAVPVPLPDLTISDFLVDYDGERRILTAKALVRNVGRGAASARFAVSFPESTGVIGNRLGGHVAGPLVPNAEQWVQTSYRVPDEMLGRTVRLRAVVEVGPDIRETNARNNQTTEQSVFLARPVPPPPDLVIAALDPTYDRKTRRLTVRVTVRNVGKSQAGSSQLRILETQRRFGFPVVTVPAIAPGRTAVRVAEVIVPVSALGAVAQLEAVANEDRRLPETNFANNGFGPVRIALQPPPEPERPDLVISGFRAAHDPATGQIELGLTVRNQGRENSGPFEVTIFDHTGFLSAMTLDFAGLAPGRSENRSVPMRLRPVTDPRTLVLQAEAVPGPGVRESDVSNNTSQQRRVVLRPPPEPELPDLAISEFRAERDSLSGQIEMSLTVQNRGREVSGPFNVDIVDQNGFVSAATLRFAGLEPGRSESRTLSVAAPVVATRRTAVMQAEAVPGAGVKESNTANNVSPRRSVVLMPPPEPEKPDLQVSGLTAIYDAERDLVTLRVVAVNNGPGASEATQVRFSELRNKISEVDMDLQPLAPGQRVALKSEKPLPPAPEDRAMMFVARVNIDQRVDETRTDNNESQVAALRIPATPTLLPDLAVRALETGKARRGAPLRVSAEIVNSGTSGSGPTELELIVTGLDPVLRAVPALRPGEVYQIQLEVPALVAWSGDTIEISVEADPEERIDEISMANNMRRSTVVLSAPIWPWLGLGGIGAVTLIVLIRLMSGGGSGQPDRKPKIAPHLVRLRPGADSGRQSAKPDPGNPGIAFELSLRPISDRGRVTVESLADTEDPET